MNLDAHIISTSSKRLHTLTVTTASPGLDRATIHAAEEAAREWARTNGHRVVSDIVSQGAYRVWVEPIPPGRLRTMRQMGRDAGLHAQHQACTAATNQQEQTA